MHPKMLFSLTPKTFFHFKGASECVWLKCQNNKTKQQFKHRKIRKRGQKAIKQISHKTDKETGRMFTVAWRNPLRRKCVWKREFPEIFFIFPKTFFYVFPLSQTFFWGWSWFVSIYLMWCLFIVLTSDNSGNLFVIVRRLQRLKKFWIREKFQSTVTTCSEHYWCSCWDD